MELTEFSRRGGKARWKDKSKKDKSDHGKMMAEAKKKKNEKDRRD